MDIKKIKCLTVSKIDTKIGIDNIPYYNIYYIKRKNGTNNKKIQKTL